MQITMDNPFTVVKTGGDLLDTEEKRSAFLEAFVGLPEPKILVHGGGKMATQFAARLGISSKMVHGRRVTDAASLEVAVMVYGGLISRTLVAGLQALGCNAIGLTGADANLIRAHKRTGWEVDYGFVGDIDTVDAAALCTLLSAGFVPVFAPLTHDGAGQLLNTNADTIAASIATALAAEARKPVQLMYCMQKPGVLENIDEPKSLVRRLDPQRYQRMREQGAIAEGMLPKLDTAFSALNSGVARVLIGQYQATFDPAANTNFTELVRG